MKPYPPGQPIPTVGASLPRSEKHLRKDCSRYWDFGTTSPYRYTFSGLINSDVTDDSSEVYCRSAILSEHDLESVMGLSARAVLRQRGLTDSRSHTPGFRRTTPSSEKYPLPRRAPSTASSTGQAAALACAFMHSSMLASPHGASEQYKNSRIPSRIPKGCRDSGVSSKTDLLRTSRDVAAGSRARARQSHASV